MNDAFAKRSLIRSSDQSSAEMNPQGRHLSKAGIVLVSPKLHFHWQMAIGCHPPDSQLKETPVRQYRSLLSLSLLLWLEIQVWQQVL